MQKNIIFLILLSLFIINTQVDGEDYSMLLWAVNNTTQTIRFQQVRDTTCADPHLNNGVELPIRPGPGTKTQLGSVTIYNETFESGHPFCAEQNSFWRMEFYGVNPGDWDANKVEVEFEQGGGIKCHKKYQFGSIDLVSCTEEWVGDVGQVTITLGPH